MISLYTVQILLYISLGTIVTWYLNYTRTKQKRLPGPISLPLIGSALQIAYHSINTRNFQLMHKLCSTYGPVVGFKAGVQNFVFVEDYQTAKQLLNSEDWSGRYPYKPIYLELTMDQNIGVLFSHGESWKKIRRFTIRSLIEFGFGEAANMEMVLDQEITDFMQRLDSYVNSSRGEISFHQYFNLPVLNMLWNVMCGGRFCCDNEEMKKLVAIIEDGIGSTSVATQPMYAFPFLRYLPGMTNQAQLIRMFGKIQAIFKEMITKRRLGGSYREIQNDFVDRFMLKIDQATEDHMDKNIYNDQQLIQSCTDLVLAGSDTSANALEFCMLYMLKYPQVQEEVQKEIDVVIGKQAQPCLQHKSRMPYTEATIMEVLRFANIAPVVMRTSIADTTLCGAFVPKDTFGLVNFTQIHKDPEIWGNPQEFDPSRFLDENNNVIKDTKLLAFGSGKRVCLGKQMAKSTLFVFFTTILQRYTLQPSSNHPELSLESFLSGVTNMPKKFYCQLTLRNSHNAL